MNKNKTPNIKKIEEYKVPKELKQFTSPLRSRSVRL